MPITTAADYFDQERRREHCQRHVLLSWTEHDLSRLPYTVQQLARCIGLPEALALVEYMGGVTLRVPHGDTPAGRALLDMLSRRIGPEAAGKLAHGYAANQVYIPTCKDALIRARDAALVRDRAALAQEGLSERDIAAILAVRYGMSDRNIWKILKKPAQEDAPPSGGTAQGSLL